MRFPYRGSARIPGQRTQVHEADEFEVLSTKFNQLADVMQQYISEAPLDRGVRNANAARLAKVVERIVGGSKTQEGAYPECCLVGRLHPNGFQEWFCSGVLVAESLVLTAGHCIDRRPTAPYLVALNAVNEDALGAADIIQARKVVVHPEYLSMRIHDVACIVLAQSSRVAPVPIASAADMNSAFEVTLVGFGNCDYKSTRGFGIQRKVSVDITAIRRSANGQLDEAESELGFESDYEFVAGGEGYDSCNGDSGGPAYVTLNGSKKVGGLTSRATKVATLPCGDGGIYTRPDATMEFIRDVAGRYNIAL